DIDEHWCRAAIKNDVGGGDPGEGGDDHLVAGTDPHRGEDQVERSRAARGCKRVLDLMALGEASLELRDLRTLGQPARHQRLAASLPLFLAGGRLRDLDFRPGAHNSTVTASRRAATSP